MRTIPLTQGKSAIIDDEDFDVLGHYNWHAHFNNKTWYAARYDPIRNYVYLHREIMGFPSGKVDHKNRDGLDCRRENLRLADSTQNNANQGRHRSIMSSQFKGVYWDKSRQKWRACIDSKHLGRFSSEVEAALAYDRAALRQWGEFACTNFPTA